MTERIDGLTTQQHQALSLLLAGKSVVETAKTMGLARQTLTKWKADPEFNAALVEELQGLRDASVMRVANLSSKAFETIERLLGSENDAIALASAKLILERLDGSTLLSAAVPAAAIVASAGTSPDELVEVQRRLRAERPQLAAQATAA